MLRQEKGITLVALIITVIILVILAAVTIISLQNSEMIKYAVEGTQNYDKAQGEEERIVNGFEQNVSKTLSNIRVIQNEHSNTMKNIQAGS